MRVPTAQRRRRGFRVRGWIIAGVILLVIILFSLRGLAGFYTDFLWFDSVGQGSTWRELLSAKVVPALVFTVVFFVIMLTSLLIADRLAPKYRSMGPEDELVERYQQFVSPYQGRIRVGVALFFALIAGVGVSSQWQEWVLFTHRVDFGVKDPQFNKDIGFYVFQLPFLRFIADWLFAGLVIVLLVTAVAHYLNGGIRFQSPFQRVTPQVKAHLSVILAVMALVKTAQYYLDRFNLDFSQRGVVTGASYTDVKAQLPALNLLIFISIVAAGLFIWNIWRRGWVLPIIAVGLWGFVSIVIGTIYPAGVQKFRVEPNEFQNEQRYIERNIAATRSAFNLGKVENKPFDYQQNLDASVVSQNAPSIDNARLWDPQVIQSTYQSLQGLQTFYKIDDVDIDRYKIDDQTRQVVLSAREISQGELPSQSWVNQHLVYTHGYGIIASPTNVAAQDGNPDFLLSGIPVPKDAPITLNQPDLYFGERQPGYALVDAKQREFDYSRPGRADATTRYNGQGRGQARQPDSPGGVRVALRRHQPAHLGAGRRQHEGSLRPRHQGPSEEARPVPRLRRRPVPGRQRRPRHVGSRRVHDDQPLPVLAEGVGPERHGSEPQLQLRPQLGEGDRRRIRRHREVLRDRPEGPVDPVVPVRRSRTCSPTSTRCPRTCRRTCAIPRTCSGCSRTCTRGTTSPRAGASTRAAPSGSSHRTRARAGSPPRSCRRRRPQPTHGNPSGRDVDRRPHAALLPVHQPAGRAGAELHHPPAVRARLGRQQADAARVVHDGELRSEELRRAEGVRDAAGGVRARTGADRQPDQEHARGLAQSDAAQPAGLDRDPGEPAAHPRRQLDPLHPALLRAGGRRIELSAVPFRRRRVRRSGPRPGEHRQRRFGSTVRPGTGAATARGRRCADHPEPARGRQRAGPAEPGRRHVRPGPAGVAPGRSGYLPDS